MSAKPLAHKDLAWDYPGVKVQGECLLLCTIMSEPSGWEEGGQGRRGERVVPYAAVLSLGTTHGVPHMPTCGTIHTVPYMRYHTCVSITCDTTTCDTTHALTSNEVPYMRYHTCVSITCGTTSCT